MADVACTVWRAPLRLPFSVAASRQPPTSDHTSLVSTPARPRARSISITEQAKALAQKYQVSSMPTFLFVKNGKQVDKLAGANIDTIKQKISSLQ